MRVDKVVLAYSGGLDTSIIIKWLTENYDCEVIAYSADIGQGEELNPIREKALKTGASKVYIQDLKEEFINDYVFPMLRGNAFYEANYLLGTSIARPLIAKEQIRIAEIEQADGVSHGCTGKGNDQIRFELAYLTLNPEIKIISPWREWNLNSRDALIEYAKMHDISVPVSKNKPYSMDRNMFHISYEGGVLEDPWEQPPEDLFLLSISPEKAPDNPEEIQIEYWEGNPVAVDGNRMGTVDLLVLLNKLAGKHGIGRIDIVENRFVGMKSRGIYETPGGTILHKAHRALETITLDREVMFQLDSMIPAYARMIYNGFWFSPERLLHQKLIDEAQKNVSGMIRLKLYKGNCTILGRKSENSLYDQETASFDMTNYNQNDAEGFIKLNALRLKHYYQTFRRK